MSKKYFLVGLLAATITSFYSTTLFSKSTNKIEPKTVQWNYYKSRADQSASLLQKILQVGFRDTCTSDASCIDIACQYAGDCNWDSDLKEIMKNCKGVDPKCLDTSCKLAGDCNWDSDLEEIMKACKGVNGDCVEVACKYAGDCNWDSDLEKIINQCEGVDPKCVDSACKLAGDCNWDSDLKEIMENCK